MHPSTRDAVAALRADRAHGASHLAHRALAALARHAEEAPASTPLELQRSLRGAARALAGARPSMVPLRTVLGAVVHRVTRVDATTPLEVREAAAFHVEAVRAEVAAARAATVEHAARVARVDHVVTLSRSGTVLDVLRTARPRVTVLASRPGGEGHGTARTLHEAGLDVALTPDSHGPRAVAEAELALVGADALLADGSVRNKTGTHALLLAAADAGVPGVVAADTWKVAPASHEADLEPLEAGEGAPPEGIPWRAQRFEEVPERVVGALVTEHGVHPPSLAHRWLRGEAWAALGEP